VAASDTGPDDEACLAAHAAGAESWATDAAMSDGRPYHIRPLRPTDRAHELAFMASLSEETRFLRTMHPLRVLPPHLLDQLMDLDYDRRMAFIAAVDDPDGERFVAVARYGVEGSGTEAEFGVTTTDEWQRQGIARRLLEQLFAYARSRGIERIVGLVLPENRRMIRLAQSLGFRAVHDPEEHIVRVTLDL